MPLSSPVWSALLRLLLRFHCVLACAAAVEDVEEVQAALEASAHTDWSVPLSHMWASCAVRSRVSLLLT